MPEGDRREPVTTGADPFAALDATAQAALVRQKQVTPRELVEAAIARIERLNPTINAVVTPLFDRALEAARGPLPEGPFTGVPMLLKDLIALQGVRLTYGSVFFREFVAPYSHEVVRRIERAGFVILGKTNTPEFGLLPVTEPRLHGPTRNPWDLTRSPGGSSGGAAAAVAAGMIPLAHASDGGGSIRIPASACGVFGLKITRGRHSEAPEPQWHGFGVQHCVSRSVRDSAAFLDVIQGPVPGDRWWAPPPKRPYTEEAAADPGRLRIAFTTADFTGRRAHPDCAAAVTETARLCEALGHVVEEATPQLDGSALRDAFVFLWGAGAATAVKEATRMLGRRPDDDQFEPLTWELAAFADRHTPADVGTAWRPLLRTGYAMARFHEPYDLLITPVLGDPPVKSGQFLQYRGLEEFVARVTEYVAYTPLCNVTGQPAMSVPLFWNADGLPVGSHVIGRFGDEATLIRLAAQLEQARPWANRWAPGSIAAQARGVPAA